MRIGQQYLVAKIMRLLGAGSMFLAVISVPVPAVSTQPLAPLSTTAVALPKTQPACLTDSTTGLIDCGNREDAPASNVRMAATADITGTVVPSTDLSPGVGPGGPIMIVFKTGYPFARYYSEILLAEGFNAFTVTNISQVTAPLLNSYDVVILGEMPLTSTQITMFSEWVNAGGNLITMRPDKELANLLGLTDAGGTLTDGYLQVNPAQAPAVGIATQTLQYHGTADRYDLNGAASVATLYSSATTATSNPAVTLRSVGANGGQAAAFTYDLARSVVYTRQGNPAWAGLERDGLIPIRSDDMLYPGWIDFNKIAIPQADEQQRLLANMILQMNLDKKPLPRFWYFPRGLKAVVVMTGDGHPGTETAGRFDQYLAESQQGCSVDNWECVRSTAYIYPNNSGLSDAQAASYTAQGFEVALHVDTGCSDYTPASIAADFAAQLGEFDARYPSLPAPSTQRLHCVVWSDWISQAKVEKSNGMRLDTTYYYWPGSWVQNRPGFFTGSGMPMRFADTDGSIIDVYQAPTQMTDESGQTYPYTVNTLLDRALGSEGYYGAFTANMHVDDATSYSSDAIISSARARSIPIVSARQMLSWLDGRNNSAFSGLSWSGKALTFTVSLGSHVDGIRAMLPISSTAGNLKSVTFNGSPISYQSKTIKGRSYAFFSASSGAYVANYGSGKSIQTIDFQPLSNKTYGDPPFTVVATATSGLPVTFTASGTCNSSGANGATVTLTGAGSCTVTAHQAGNSSYYPASDVPQTFNIAKATPVITWSNPADIVYGTPLGGTQLSATASVPGSWVYTPPAGTLLNAGANQILHVDFAPTDAANYNLASKEVLLDVVKANQTITFDSLSDKVIGAPAFVVTATASSGLTVTFTASGDCSVAGSTVTLLKVGTCTVTASQAGNANYNVAPNDAHAFTIQRAKLFLALISLNSR